MPMPTISVPDGSHCCFAATSNGTSSRHGAHQVAQKLHRSALPCQSLSRRGRPSRSVKRAASSCAAPLRDWSANAPNNAPAIAAASPTPAMASASRRLLAIAQEYSNLGYAGALHHPTGLRGLEREPFVPRVEHRKPERRILPAERKHAHVVHPATGEAPALVRGEGEAPLEQEELDVLRALGKKLQLDL